MYAVIQKQGLPAAEFKQGANVPSHETEVQMAVVKRASGVPYESGGLEHSGWLPPGAAIPLPTPVLRLTLDLTIEGEEREGYRLIFTAREAPGFGNDYWFKHLADAEAAAGQWFGIKPCEWQVD
jgi:hypothetical protein